MKRDKRCCVLFTSGAAANLVTPGCASPGATKHAISSFGEAMYYELKKNVDVTVWEPLCVSTSIHVEAPPGLATLDAKQAVSDVFNRLGDRKTHGSFRFALMMPLMSAIDSEAMLNEIEKKKDMYDQAMEKKEKEA